MTSIEMLSRTVGAFEPPTLSIKESWPRPRSWLGIAAEPLRPTATIFVRSFSGPPTSAWRCWTATRPHLELYRRSLEQRGLAASTVDRRLTTVCGFYRYAHIDGRIVKNPAQYVRRPRVHPSERRGLDRTELGTFLFTAERFDHGHAALAVLLGLNGLRVSEACSTNVEDLAFERDTAPCGSSGRATGPLSSRSSPVPRARSISRSVNATLARSCAVQTDNASTGAPRTGGLPRSPNRPTRSGVSAHAPLGVHHGRPRRRRPAPRRTDRGPARGPSDDHHLRPTTRELRPTRRLRRGRLRRRRLTRHAHSVIGYAIGR